MDSKLRDEFWHALSDSPFVMIKRDGTPGHAEPMTAQLDSDAHQAIWFFVSRGNRIAAGGGAMAQFASKGHDLFACLAGTLVEETRNDVWDKHWSRQTEAWFPNGRSDPDVMMLRFEIAEAEIWTVDPSLMGKLKQLTGAGTITPEQAGRHEVGTV